MFEYTYAEGVEQLAALPLGIFLWLRWLMLVNLSSLFLVRRVQARWVLAAMLFIIVANRGLLMAGSGVVKLLSIPHLVVWLPLLPYLAMQLRSGQVDIRKPFGIWCLVVLLSDLVSVVFDLRDGAQYLLGDRAVMTPDPTAGLPVPTLLVIAASLAALVAYVLGFPRKQAVARQEEG